MLMGLPYGMVLLLGRSIVLAQQAVNHAATAADYKAPVNSKADLLGTAASYGNADLVNAPKWAQWTSLGLGVWRLLMFVGTMAAYAMQPILSILHILHIMLRPLTLLVQLTWALFVGIPLGALSSLTRVLYPAYLFLGSAAIIGLLIGLMLALFSRFLYLLIPSERVSQPLSDNVWLGNDNITTPRPKSKKSAGKQRMTLPLPTKRSPPSTRSIMSSQPSLQTPTIFEESEASSYDEEAFNTDSDHTPGRSSPGYMDYKSLAVGVEGPRRRKF